MPASALYEDIEKQRRLLGSSLTIMGHHYQAEEVIRHTDLRGDSLELARKAASADAEYIMFCGVYFMAESAALLAREGQQVHLPDPSAECSMALMASPRAVERALTALGRGGRRVVPLAYVNSTLEVKAVVGRHGGSVCTSANARAMLEWALNQGDAVLFLPDQNLGLNTADLMGLPEHERYVADGGDAGDPFVMDRAGGARLVLWPGYCSIHTCFTVAGIAAMRAAYPGAKVIVHPECTPEVVKASDAAGSTSFIIRYADEMPAGGTLIIGTEVNLVKRLAAQHAGRIRILPLAESSCSHMAQVTEQRLAAVLRALVKSRETGEPSPFKVSIAEALKAPAREALERMLAVC